MKEKELRIALVCFGGVSLAIYMYGISKEILKLVRASCALHRITNRSERSAANFFDKFDRDDPEYDTDEIYFELLRDIGQTLELRVIVDVIAGASAGGINGTMLARALSHDLPMGALRDLWLNHADVGDLLAPEARASAASKLILKPMIWLLGATGLWEPIKDPEVRQNLSLFVRSRWFRPPLSGMRMTELMYNAVTSMVDPGNGAASLLPAGHGLDLYVAVTDYHGYEQPIPIHNPPIIHEREHRHILHFSHRQQANGEVVSDFALENAAALAFAARATSSFPGAFPPAQIREMDEFVARKSVDWPRRAEFMAGNFDPYARKNIDPAMVYFIDGSVLNNRPFRQAITAIRDRPAYRQVDRRLVYIDPDPDRSGASNRRDLPGFFSTLKGALSDLPSADPVADELGWVSDFNDRMKLLREIIENARPNVSQFVAGIIGTLPDGPIESGQIRAWREQINAQVRVDAGFAYEGYIRLKLASVRAFIASLIAGIRGAPPLSQFGRTIAEIIDVWATETGVVYGKDLAIADNAATERGHPRWTELLLDFDVDYRKRRLHFLIEGLNRLYQPSERMHFEDRNWRAIDALKRNFYNCLEDLKRQENVAAFTASTRDLAEDLFRSAPPPGDSEKLTAYAQSFVQRHREAHRRSGRPAGGGDQSQFQHQRHRYSAGLDRSGTMASASAPRNPGRPSRLPFLGRFDVSGHALARGGRTQRDPGGSHQPAGRDCARGIQRKHRAEGRPLCAFCRVLFPRLSRKRLSARTHPRAGSVDRHRLQFGATRYREAAQLGCGAEGARVQEDTRRRGEIPAEQRRTDRQIAPLDRCPRGAYRISR